VIPPLLILIASGITFIAISLLRPFAISIKLVDTPSIRKKHSGSIPLIGGISMFLGVIFTILISSNDLNNFSYFLSSSLIIIIIGALDDHQDISASFRFLFQVLIGILLVYYGKINIESLGSIINNEELILNQWTYLVTVLAIITGINAVNMADGIDGLAGGNSLITFLAILYLSIETINRESLLIVILFCSVLPVFLIYNLCLGISSKKKIFMGDAGSMFLGLSIVWVLIDLSQGSSRSFSPVIALWLFAIPLIDLVAAFLRRLLSGSSPFNPDLFHIHHLLMKFGIKEKYVLILILFASLLMATIGILGELYAVEERFMFIGFLVIFGIYIITYRFSLIIIKNKKN